MKALDFIHALALPNADPIGLAKKMQDDLDHLVKTVQDKSQENYALRQKLEQLDDFARNIHIVKTQHEETLKSYKNDYQNYEKQIECLKVERNTLKNAFKIVRGHKDPIQSGSAEVQIIDDPQGSTDLGKQVHTLLEELKREREDNKALSGRVKSLEEQYSLMAALYNNQVDTIKAQQNTMSRLRALLTTIDEVISESDV